MFFFLRKEYSSGRKNAANIELAKVCASDLLAAAIIVFLPSGRRIVLSVLNFLPLRARANDEHLATSGASDLQEILISSPHTRGKFTEASCDEL